MCIYLHVQYTNTNKQRHFERYSAVKKAKFKKQCVKIEGSGIKSVLSAYQICNERPMHKQPFANR